MTIRDALCDEMKNGECERYQMNPPGDVALHHIPALRGSVCGGLRWSAAVFAVTAAGANVDLTAPVRVNYYARGTS